MGSLADLTAVREAVTLPVLRKDFILDPYQVVESAASGADAILLIVRMLGDSQLSELFGAAGEYGMDALVEIYDEADLERANDIGARLIGINNRDLRTFNTSCEVARGMVSRLSGDQVAVAASGISCRADMERSFSVGVSRFLIGESLVRADNPVAMLRELCGEVAE